jgi:N-acyl-D-amino-acid deacylase
VVKVVGMHMKTVLFLAGLFSCGLAQAPVQEPLDLVILNGTVIDGSGKKAFHADVGIKNGIIVRIGNLGRTQTRDVIDAAGLVVAPGFIDVHTHADRIERTPLAENFIRMGVTSVLAGNCGGSMLEVAQEFQKIRTTGISVNFATLVGHNSVRQAVMGSERRAPTAEELSRMKELVARALSEGAIGLSTGLQYVPGVYAEAVEIIELAKVAAAHGGVYASHMRNEGTEIDKAIEETIRIGEEAHCPVQISHIKIDSPSQWGASRRVLALLEKARGRGVVVHADQYAYEAGSSGLGIRFPAWSLEGGRDQTARRLNDPATWQKIKREMLAMLEERGFHDLSWAVVASYRPDPSCEGLSIKDIAQKLKGDNSSDAQLEVAREIMSRGGADMVYHFMSEDDIVRFMRDPQVSVGSDSGLLTPGDGMPHPRGYGNNPRILGRYVRAQKVISLEEAVRKMTSLPAAQFGLQKRGMIRKDYAADIVLFRKETVADRATYANPHQYPDGIPVVIVNGVPVVRNGSHTGARPGQILRNTPGMSPQP